MRSTVVALIFVMILARTRALSGSDLGESATNSGLQNNVLVNPAAGATPLQFQSVLPPEVLEYLKDPKATFDFARVPGIRSTGMLELVRGFRAATNLSAKFRHAVVLSRYGNEETVAMLANTLTNEFSGRKLTKAEAFDLAGIAASMESLAERYDSAVWFLVSGCDPVFWERHKQWVSPNGDYYDIYLMTDMCLRGLAHSGRPEALTVLQEFRNGQRDPSKYKLAGAVVSAAYEYYEAQQRSKGTQTTSRASADIYAIMREFRRWRDESPDGREWRAWAERCDGMTNQVQTGFVSPTNTAPAPVSATPVGSTNIPHAAYVDRLLADGRKIVPYAEQKALNSADIGMLVKRYHEIPSVTNKWGITASLAYRGDERVVDLFWNTLTREYAGRRFSDSRLDTSEAMQLATLMSFVGYQASRSERAFDLLKNGVQPAFWQTNVTWSVHGQPATSYLVGASIEGLAWSGRDDAWQVVLDLKTKGDGGYLKQYSGAIVDAAFCRYLIVNGKVGQSANQNPLADMVAWEENTPDGRVWQQWHDKIMGIDENMMWHPSKNTPTPVPLGTK